MSTEQILESARNLALIQRGTGVGGAKGTRVTLSLQEYLDLSQDQAVDFVVTALNSGLDPEALQQVAERAGDVGGVDFISLMLASRGTGLDINRAGRSIPAVIQALTRTQEGGELAKDLQDIGIDDRMSLNQRIEFLLQVRREGRINEGQINRAIGGAQNKRFFGPFERAMHRNLVGAARDALLDPNAAENTIAELEANDLVQAQERANQRELRRRLAIESNRMREAAETLSEGYTQMIEEDSGSAVSGFMEQSRRGCFHGLRMFFTGPPRPPRRQRSPAPPPSAPGAPGTEPRIRPDGLPVDLIEPDEMTCLTCSAVTHSRQTPWQACHAGEPHR